MRRSAFAVVIFATLIAQSPRVPYRSIPDATPIRPIEPMLRALPLSFERNVGQLDADVDFAARSGGATVLFNREGVRLASSRQPAPIGMRFVGANPNPASEATDSQPGRVHYLLGNDPARWHRDVPTFGKVRYRAIYPGVDVVYYGTGSRLEYDLVVTRRRALDPVRLTFDGATNVAIAADGALVVETGDGALRQAPPTVWRTDDASHTPLPSRYRRIDERTVAFEVDAPPDAPLVVDPVLSYASYFGGSDYDTATSVARDSAGNIYVAGYTRSADLPTTAGSLSPTAPGGFWGIGRDGFVIKLNPGGSQLIYATYLGGTNGDEIYALAVDSSGAAYLGGATYSTDFPTTPGAFDRTCGGSTGSDCGSIAHVSATDGFLAKLSPSGSALAYATFLGGFGQESVRDLAIDTSGNVYAVGTTTSSDFPSTPGVFDDKCECNSFSSDGFLVKLNPAGSALVYGTFFRFSDPRTSASGGASAVAVDSAGRAYVGANTNNRKFPTTADAFQSQVVGGFGYGDAVVAILDATATSLEFASFLGGSFPDYVSGIAVGPDGSVAITGTTWSTDFPTYNASQPNYTGTQTGDWATGNAFVVLLNANHQRVYSTYYGGKGTSASDVVVTPLRYVYISGSTRGGAGICDNDGGPTPCLEAYFALFDPGGRFVAESIFGGSADDAANAMYLTTTGQLTLVGYTKSAADFPIVRGLQTTYRGGSQDAFIATFSPYLLAIFKDGKGRILSSPEGIDCGALCSIGFGTDTVTLTAIPDSGWAFAGWGGDDDCRDGVVTMLNDRRCTVTFVTSLGTPAPPGTVDLNGDGAGDVFTYNPRTGVWNQQFGNRSGQFGSTGQTWSPDWEVHAGDFNGDGIADFFLYGPDGTWVKAINNGRGDFSYFASHWDRGWTISIIDLDGDRRSDAFLYNPSTGIWVKAYSVGPTPLTDFRYASGTWAPGWTATPVELNGDGRADLFLYNTRSGGWMRALNDSDAGFTTTAGSWSPGWEVHAGDFNADGRSDIFLYSQASGQWFICTNNGSGFDYVTGVWDRGWSVTTLDLNADNRTDLFLYAASTGVWVEALNAGGTSFTYATGQWSPGWQISATGFNADRRGDLLLYNPDTGQWFQAINAGVGAFTYGTGFWEKNLTIVASMPKIP